MCLRRTRGDARNKHLPLKGTLELMEEPGQGTEEFSLARSQTTSWGAAMAHRMVRMVRDQVGPEAVIQRMEVAIVVARTRQCLQRRRRVILRPEMVVEEVAARAVPRGVAQAVVPGASRWHQEDKGRPIQCLLLSSTE